MIPFKKFVNSLNTAVIQSQAELAGCRLSSLSHFFEDEPEPGHLLSQQLQPKQIQIKMPDSEQIFSVPLISLVPLSMQEIKTADVTIRFEMTLINDELYIIIGSQQPANCLKGKIEIKLDPLQSQEDFEQLIHSYETTLKSQFS
ncbi:hypothetical protein M2347_003178 [Chryseobacterium sp. H1D6B]|uniref:DUF2589 domain-containing protein n=1 Tax=Chryseobacterium sp. H1D6B TaxID=2940588 RepID=UPI0015C7FB6A|nr:DUF2589 domain-containing protein [Chryseobacterium sp. H1D6B]MDH6253451.1 hypothetical protein [Chryseobacterium sp. H1D6B]